jgi:cytochrome c2
MMVILFVVYSCTDAPNGKSQQIIDTSTSFTNKSELYIDLEKVLGQWDHTHEQEVHVAYDHYFKSPKRYKGFLINPIIDSIVRVHKFDTTNIIAVFECSDGYKPMMDLSKIFGETKGYIVYKDLDIGTGKNWPDSINAKFKPYYLVWDHVKKEDDSFIWPYGLIGIKLISKGVELESIYPYKKPSLVNGFNLFRNNCLKCHSINKIGGSMGPEFNIPKNITEYWKEEDIISFAKNPLSYRYNSRMLPITGIKDSDYKEIISYIKYMKDNKIK